MLRFIQFLTALSVFLFLPLFHMQSYSEISNESYLEGKIPPTNCRYATYLYMLQMMKEREVKVIIETGTARGGKHNCCGDGCSTIIFAEWAKDHGAFLYSVDNNKESIQNAAKDLGVNQSFVSFVQSDSVEFLKKFNQPIDFLYLDSSDFDPKNPTLSQKHHLKEIVTAYPLFHEKSIVVVDDCGDLPQGGQGKQVIDYLIQRGWKLIVYGHQAILVKQGGNPFAISFQPKDNLDNEDYIEIQQQLRKIDMMPILHALYPKDQGFTHFGDLEGRCVRGVKQVLIDPDKGLYPSMHLEKIGEGSSSNCIVCCVPLENKRPEFADSIPDALRKTGYNGYFLYQRGGFPNPTGREIQYVGVPYCFKIFMMLEAYNRGFNNVLWLDSAVIPLRDPTPLFDWIEQKGALINGWSFHPDAWRFVYPQTRQLLEKLNGTDVLKGTYVNTIFFGLRMDTDLFQQFAEHYYKLVDLGTPFLSCFPEEFVISSILSRPEFSSWKSYPYRLLSGAFGGEDTQELMDQKKSQGYYFYHRKH